jgi:hypothetical protein
MRLSSILIACFSGVLNVPHFAFATDGDEANGNQEVLESWQKQSGQSATLVNNSNGSTLEWHGQVTEDLYTVDTSNDSDEFALSGLQEGTFSLTTLQGDLRSTTEAGDINYIQGGVSLTRDRAKQTLYSSQMTNLQFGRAGQGYQISGGDIVADFSRIGSNLGLRGVYSAKQLNATTLYGFAGVVSDSWESLFNRHTLTNQPARSRYLRDAVGGKIDYKLNESWNVFGTAQTYSDRRSSLANALAIGQASQSGSTGTVGLGYRTLQSNFSVEVGTSRNGVDTAAAGDTLTDKALLVDMGYAWQTLNLHAGYHNIGLNYTSLAQNVVPGIRESFVGGDWFITPNLSYSNDIRRSEMRTVNFFDQNDTLNLVDTLVNRLNYNVTALPGLNIGLQDMRNWGKVEANTSRNNMTQLNIFYSTQHYSSGLTLSNARQRTNTNPLSNSTTDGVQVTLGRQILPGELIAFPSISGGIQFNGGYQQQRIANNTETTSGTQGVSVNVQSVKLGQLMFSIMNVDTRQPTAKAVLNTKVVNLDWTKVISDALAFRAYIRNNFINHGDRLQTFDEKIVGAQLDYQW